MPPDTLKSALDRATQRLASSGCETPGLDARLLLQQASGLSREDLILEPERQLSPTTVASFEAMVARRAAREPVSRILGEREFYGRRFTVTPDVLDPRADTETLIDAVLPLMPPRARILDLGTGSGAIAVTLLAERPDATAVAVDVSANALAVAEVNAVRLGVKKRLTLVEGSWFDNVTGRFDLIVSNPPYIPAGDVAALAPDVRDFDPHLALDGGNDGLWPYRAIAAGAAGHLAGDGAIAVEIGVGQEYDIIDIFSSCELVLAARAKDLGGHVRSLTFQPAENVAFTRLEKKTFGKLHPSG